MRRRSQNVVLFTVQRPHFGEWMPFGWMYRSVVPPMPHKICACSAETQRTLTASPIVVDVLTITRMLIANADV